MLLVEAQQQIDDRIPCGGALRLDAVAADLGHERAWRLPDGGHLFSVQRRVRRRRRAVHDSYVLCERRDHQVRFHAREFLRGHLRSRLDQHFEPHGEAIRIELFVQPGPGRAP